MTQTQKIEHFTDLITWREAHKLVLQVYLLTKKFPQEELYGLTSQIRRAVVSITSNIAEGFGRGSYKEKVQFYLIARGSLIETENQLYIARDIHYISAEDFLLMYNQTTSIGRLLTGLIRSSRK